MQNTIIILDSIIIDEKAEVSTSSIVNGEATFSSVAQFVDEADSLLPGNLHIVGIRASGHVLAGLDAEKAISNIVEHVDCFKRTKSLNRGSMLVLTSNALKNRFQLLNLENRSLIDITDVSYHDKIDHISFVYLDLKKELCTPSMDLSADALTVEAIEEVIVI